MFFDALVIWIHLTAAAVFIGPQVFLAVVAIPAMRSLDDVQARQQATRAITRGFGTLGGVALLVLLVTGVYNYYQFDDFIDNDLFPRYFITMQIKLLLVTVVVILSGLHAMVLGRRLEALQESGASEDELAQARRWSMLASIGTLVASIAILLCAALLTSDWSKVS